MWKTFAAFALGLLLASCDVSGLVPKEHQEFAKHVVNMVQMGDGAGLQAVSDPALWQQLPADIRGRMAAVFPASEAPSSITISSWKSNYNNGWSNVEMRMLYKYSNRDIEVNIGFRSAGSRNVLTMIYVKPITGETPSAPPGTAPGTAPGAAPGPQPQPGQQPQQNDDKTNSL